MSYDRHKARSLGYTAHCSAPLEEPVTVSGTYKCTAGHAHSARWNNGHLSVSATGYDYAFLGALDAAGDVAMSRHDPETRAYWVVFTQVLTAHGYGDVALPIPTEDLIYPD